MRVTWEAVDIIVGRVCINTSCNEKLMVGYLSCIHNEPRYVLISLLDGGVGASGSKEQLATALTDGSYLPAKCFD